MNDGAAGYIWSSSRQPWGLRDLTVYVTHYYHTVIHAANVSGFRMSHVRVRAWAFLGGGTYLPTYLPTYLVYYLPTYLLYIFKDIVPTSTRLSIIA